MRHRVFIAINLPEDVKKELVNYQYKWPELPCRWTKPDNIHITLEFLGYVSDDELLKVLQNAKDIASKHESFTVVLNKICYGPPGKIPPRMIWAIAAPQSGASLAPLGRGENFHITLGRIKTWEFKAIDPEERPEINEDINLSFEVNSIELVESQLKRGGPNYTILESCPLKS